MHLLIPFAASTSEQGRPALRELSLPHLSKLIAGPAERDDGDESSFSPPHERALAHAIGMTGDDGALPWAAHLAAQDGIDVGERAWGLVTPVHWHVGTDQVTLVDPAELQLDDAESRALFAAVTGLFDGGDYAFVYGAPLRWYLAHTSLADQRTASLDRVIGRGVDAWMPPRPLQRLQNEVQMALHEHPVNDAREARGLAPVNSFWLSGCGVHQDVRVPVDLRVDDRLRGSALAEDWATWQDAWRALDAELEDARGTLTLCGERSSATWRLEAPSLWQRLTQRASAGASDVLGSL